MSDTGNVFNNSPVVPPELGGQGEPVGTENVNQNPTPATPPAEGQGVQTPIEGQGTPAPVQKSWAEEYKTPEEMYEALQKTKQSYDSLRPQFTRVTQELSTLKKGNNPQGEHTQSPTPQQPQTGADILLAKVAEMVTPIREQNEELIMQNTVARVASEHPDFIELAPDIKQILADEPQLWHTKNPIETAYKLAKANKAGADIGKAVTEARTQAYADRDIKIINSVDNRTPVNTGGNVEKTPDQLIRDGILSAAGKGGSIF